MSKKRAIEICKLLKGSMVKAKETIPGSSNLKMFSHPSISKKQLQNKRDKLIKQYKLTKTELK